MLSFSLRIFYLWALLRIAGSSCHLTGSAQYQTLELPPPPFPLWILSCSKRICLTNSDQPWKWRKWSLSTFSTEVLKKQKEYYPHLAHANNSTQGDKSQFALSLLVTLGNTFSWTALIPSCRLFRLILILHPLQVSNSPTVWKVYSSFKNCLKCHPLNDTQSLIL